MSPVSPRRLLGAVSRSRAAAAAAGGSGEATRIVPATPREPPPPIDPGQLLGALPMPVLLLDPDNRFRFVNHAAEQFLSMSASQLALLRLEDLLPQDNPIFMLLTQVRQGDATVTDHALDLESPRLSKLGIAVHGTPMADAPGMVLVVMQDGSAARALDRQLTFRSAARSVTGMAAILAHEVKNPLSGIRGAAQLLEASSNEADRIRGLVDRMEVFSEKPVERGAVNIHRVLERVRRLAQTGFAAHIRFSEHYDPSLPPVWGNRDQLVQVFLNLVKNAAESITDAGETSGEVILSTAYRHGVRLAMPGSRARLDLPLLVTVRDNGPGIPEDMRLHLFEPFVTSKPTGSGLGLALVAKIVGDHGGLIELNSRPGRTEFQLHLPVLTDGDSDGGY
jgi:two-component system nitrogen regulation sensor histidine kinase GlnL